MLFIENSFTKNAFSELTTCENSLFLIKNVSFSNNSFFDKEKPLFLFTGNGGKIEFSENFGFFGNFINSTEIFLFENIANCEIKMQNSFEFTKGNSVENCYFFYMKNATQMKKMDFFSNISCIGNSFKSSKKTSIFLKNRYFLCEKVRFFLYFGGGSYSLVNESVIKIRGTHFFYNNVYGFYHLFIFLT